MQYCPAGMNILDLLRGLNKKKPGRHVARRVLIKLTLRAYFLGLLILSNMAVAVL
jgi:hypothetical protein